MISQGVNFDTFRRLPKPIMVTTPDNCCQACDANKRCKYVLLFKHAACSQALSTFYILHKRKDYKKLKGKGRMLRLATWLSLLQGLDIQPADGSMLFEKTQEVF